MGAFFGLSAGISPGPLLTLVITETLKHNRKEGIKVAISPLVTDIPIIIITYLIFSRLSQIDIILNIISISGGIYFTYLGYETIKVRPIDIHSDNPGADSLKKGVIANLLNPHPYIFWLTIGIPTAIKAYNDSIITAVIYFLAFYIMLTGSKVVIALVSERSKNFLNKRSYRITMFVLGAILLFFAVYFISDGLRSLLKNL